MTACPPDGDPATYTVTYDGNTSTGGTAPTDSNSPYASGATVTVLGNTGSLVKTDNTFAGWNTAANGSGTSYAAGATFAISADTVLYAQWTPDSTPTFTTIAALQAHLASQDANIPAKPYPVKLNVVFNSVWTDLYAALLAAGRFVALDLSDSTGVFANFDSGSASDGQQYIVRLVLPDTFVSVEGDSEHYESYFKHYTALKEIGGANVADIGAGSFSGYDYTAGDYIYLTSLTTADFPKATSIGEYAFDGTSLTTASFPFVTTIGNRAFECCAALTTANFPKTTGIGIGAFNGCIALTSIRIAANAAIDAYEHDAGTRFGDFRLYYEGNGKLAGVYTYTDGAWARTGDLP